MGGFFTNETKSNGYSLKQMLIICLVLLTVANTFMPAFVGTASANSLLYSQINSEKEQEPVAIGELEEKPEASKEGSQDPVRLASSTFANSTAIDIPNSGSASPYPSTINVTGMPNTTSRITVTLTNFGHYCMEDVDILLVGPLGQYSLVVSDVGGCANDNSGRTLVFADSAASNVGGSLPAAGTYKPTNSGGGDSFASPAPSGSYNADFSVFNGTDPNGTWSLYVTDDSGGDVGTIGDGWSITAIDKIIDPRLPQGQCNHSA